MENNNNNAHTNYQNTSRYGIPYTERQLEAWYRELENPYHWAYNPRMSSDYKQAQGQSPAAPQVNAQVPSHVPAQAKEEKSSDFGNSQITGQNPNQPTQPANKEWAEKAIRHEAFQEVKVVDEGVKNRRAKRRKLQ